MLYLLTGEVQIGKTRWLHSLIAELEAQGAICEGVIAPGIWKENADGTFDKLGITNEMLPQHKTVTFALRDDIAKARGVFDETSQAANAQMMWHIFDDSIVMVNSHFADLITHKHHVLEGNNCEGTASEGCNPRRILIVDELGRLELMRGGGLTEAMKLLAEGPDDYYSDAIVIARDALGLPEEVEHLFGKTWDTFMRISPSDEAKDAILSR